MVVTYEVLVVIYSPCCGTNRGKVPLGVNSQSLIYGHWSRVRTLDDLPFSFRDEISPNCRDLPFQSVRQTPCRTVSSLHDFFLLCLVGGVSYSDPYVRGKERKTKEKTKTTTTTTR